MRTLLTSALLALAVACPFGATALADESADSSVATDATRKKTRKKTRRKARRKRKAKRKARQRRQRAKRQKQRKKAPPKRKSKWGVGLTGGVNIADVAGDEDEELETKAGFNINLEILYEFNRYFQFQSGLGYTTKGTYAEVEVGGSRLESTLSFSYIELPAMVRLVMDDWKVKPFLHGGLYLAFLVDSEREDKLVTEQANGSTSSQAVTQEIPGASTFDYGFKIGVGVEYALNHNVSLIAQLDFTRGFADPWDDTEKGDAIDPDGSNVPVGGAAEDIDRVHSVFQIGAGALFRF